MKHGNQTQVGLADRRGAYGCRLLFHDRSYPYSCRDGIVLSRKGHPIHSKEDFQGPVKLRGGQTLSLIDGASGDTSGDELAHQSLLSSPIGYFSVQAGRLQPTQAISDGRTLFHSHRHDVLPSELRLHVT